MRAALIGVIMLATLTAAPAAAWEEVPFRTLPGDGIATCLRATGTEGGLAALGPLDRRSASFDLLAAGTGGLVVRERVRFPSAFECAAVREQGGAGVAAAPVVRPGREIIELRVAVRDQGGAFGRPVPLGRATVAGGAHDVAVSSRGDALVAWIQPTQGGERSRIAVVRRVSGAPFGPVQALTPWRPRGQFAGVPVAAALDQDGRATVAWARHRTIDRFGGDAFSVQAAAAPAGGGFGPAQVLTRGSREVERISLAAAGGGASLLAHDSDRVLRLFERAAGASGFGPARQLGASAPEDVSDEATEPAVALRDDGAAVVAWRQGAQIPAVRAITRLPGQGFGPERDVAARDDRGFGGGFGAFAAIPSLGRVLAPVDYEVRLRVALSDAGRTALAWTAPRALGDAPVAARGATGTLTGGFGAPGALGSPARGAIGSAALLLPGSEPAVAWVDNTPRSDGFGVGDLESPTGGGRIHLARADSGAPAPAPPPLRTTLSAPRLQRLFSDQPVRLRIRCAAACDVRAYIRRGGEVAAGAGASIAAGRSRELLMEPNGFDTLPPRRPGPVTVRVRVSAPGSAASRTLRLGVRLAHRAVPPVPRLLDARAVRRGRSVLVSWRTAFPARRISFSVQSAQTKLATDYGAFGFAQGKGRTRFTVRLRPERPNSLRRILITAADREGGHARKVTVRVTR